MIKNINVIIALFLIFNISAVYTQNYDSLKINNYIKQADIYLDLNHFEESREFALEALNIDPNCGEAYILIGSAYIKSVESCTKNPLEKSLIFCLAIDKFKEAKELDNSVSERAELLIEVYSDFLPDRNSVFIDAKEGEKYHVGCWINEETTLRFKDKD